MSRKHSRNESGFTLIEAITGVVVIGLMSSIALPPAARWMQVSRLDSAQITVASDLQTAVSIAGRERKPVIVYWTPGTMSYTIADRATGTTYRVRGLGSGTDFGMSAVTFAPDTVVIFPGGVASGPLNVTLGWSGSSRTVALTRAGLVRLP